ncbi:DUF1641 domain-containing protein [Methanophagales archaeon]|nr:MAG: DUF1641 domain-containing protein [Methanophagales archaeon]RLG31772.1 MAG: hypothetical protein DRN97_08990 [Methanosarcinales archaeon]
MTEEKMVKEKEALVLELEPSDLDTLAEILSTIKFLRNFMNDQMLHDVSEIMSALFKLTNAMASTDLVDIMERGLQDPELDKALLNPPKVGTWGLIRAMKDEEVRKGMGIMIELLKAIGRASTS